MQFNSFHFIVFFPIVLAVYFVIPRKLRHLWLLGASYYFYMCWNARYALLLFGSTAITYCGSLLIFRLKKANEQKKAKAVLAVVLAVNFGILSYFKYANFFIHSVETALNKLSVPTNFSTINVLLPVGISFYIFQAVGYSFDIYYEKLEPERDFLRYALFVSFFPQLVAGPIERSTNLIPQLRNVDSLRLWDIKRIQRGALIMLYGFILKTVISDRAAIAVDTVFMDFLEYSPGAYVIATLLFTVQLYCDFAGYTYIAIGSAKIMGIDLMNNFNAPFLAVSIADLWTRWHISLSTWFKDYLYIPLGGSRKGKRRKYINLSIVFIVSGLWHGAGWNFVLWGFLHAVFRVCGEITLPYRRRIWNKLGIRENSVWFKNIRRLITFGLFSFALLFFRAQDIGQLKYMLWHIAAYPWQLKSIWGTGFGALSLVYQEWAVLAVSIVFLTVSDIMRENKVPFMDWFEQRCLAFRMGTFIVGILLLLMFGIYGSGYNPAEFIYFQF